MNMNEKAEIFGNRVPRFLSMDMFFNAVMGLLIAAELFAICVLSYLGTFSRYISDDYCEAVITRGGAVLPVVFNIYREGSFRGTNRFTKFLFLTLAEKFEEHNIQILPALMIFIWLVGLVWMVNQFRKFASIRLPIMFDYFVAVSVVFFSAWQAPNYFQTFLWRSGMVTHFAPLVFMPILGGFILHQINSSRKLTWWVCLLVILASFLVGGFSEPPTTFVIVFILMAMIVVWRWGDVSEKRTVLTLLSYALLGTLIALIAMFFAPGNLSYGNSSFANLILSFGQTFKYTYEFIVDTIKTLPLPSLVSFLIPFLVIFGILIKPENQDFDAFHRRQIWILLALVPLIQYLLIAASFAPSAYGQSYPAARARFLGRFIMTAALMLEGGLLGILVTQYNPLPSRSRLFFPLASVVLLVLALYPLRAGLVLSAKLPDYRQWASSWDMREAGIYKSIKMGEQDLVVRLLPPRDGVKEIDGLTRHWVNRCVADYYEIDTIRSVPMSD